MLDQEQIQEFESIYNILKENPENYHGYEKLGAFYQKTNINQAFLCYEQAWGLCNDVNRRKDLEERMQFCKKDSGFQVHPASFIILSYNAREMMIDCLESIRKGCVPGSYEIVVVDNNSQDGIRDYLVEQKDIVLQLNDHNTSFAAGCNQGVKLANPYNDIFLLNNDTIVPPLALFYMRLALYEAKEIGSVGPMTNFSLSWQMEPGNFQSKEQWLDHAGTMHLPSMNVYENKVWLSGFALMIKRQAWDYIGNLDERFIKGNFEDTDYGFRLLKAGYRNVLCHNAFIYHYGSVSMSKDPAAYNKSLRDNKKRLEEKLGIDLERYTGCYKEMIDMMNVPGDKSFSVLEIGCGLGQTLSRIKYCYPNATVYGIEENAEIAKIGARVANVLCADVEEGEFPVAGTTFDYILFTDVLNRFENGQKVISNLKNYLKPGGMIIVLTRNLLFGKVFMEILKGKWETLENKDPGIKHFYTKKRTVDLLVNAGLRIQGIIKMAVASLDICDEEKKCLDAVKSLPGVVIGEDFMVVSYIITAVN